MRPMRLFPPPLLSLLLLGWTAQPSLLAADPPPAAKSTAPRYALLVGCTEYKSLDRHSQLYSAPNDIALLQGLLTERFGFPAENIRVLAEGRGEDRRPTREHIRREFKKLAEDARRGSRIFIWLSGHGSRQPGRDPSPDAQPKPRNMRQTFLPADVGHWENDGETVKNAILDYELREWTQAITARGAIVWAVVDACHSGTVFRDAEGARCKGVSAEALGVPEKMLTQAAKAPPPEPLADLPSSQAGLAAIYACQPQERAWEVFLPKGGKEKHGLLTYLLVQELNQANRRLTYRQLTENICRRCAELPPPQDMTPMAEFDQDKYVLEQEEFRAAPFRLLAKGDRWEVNGGAVHGLTVGSVLKVRPPASETNPGPFTGHVRVTAVRSLASDVEPSRDPRYPAPEKLRAGGECLPVFIDYGELGLHVAAAAAVPAKPDWDAARLKAAAEELRKQPDRVRAPDGLVRQLAEERGALFRRADHLRQADWVVCALGAEVYLLRRGQLQTAPGPAGVDAVVVGLDGQEYLLPAGPTVRRYGPAPAGEARGPWLKERLERIARAETLLRLAGEPAAGAVHTAAAAEDTALAVGVELLAAQTRRPFRWGRDGLNLPESTPLLFRVKNLTRSSGVYLTVLLIDGDYRIEALFPQKGNSTQPWYPDDVVPVRHRVGAAAGAGRETVLVIAVRAQDKPADFTWLAQPGLRAPPGAMRTPLDQLFGRALSGQRDAGGLPASAVRDYLMVQRSYKVVPPPPAPPK